MTDQAAATRRFPIRLGPRSRPVLRVFGARDDTAWVDLGPDGLAARFGWSSMRTPLANITGWQIEGPWLWITAIGIRRSWRAREMTYGGNHKGGVKITFREPVRVTGLSTTALYVTVADLEGLAAALRELGIPGQDARKGPTA